MTTTKLWRSFGVGLLFLPLLSCAPEGSPESTSSRAGHDGFLAAAANSPELRRKLLLLIRQAEAEERASLPKISVQSIDIPEWRKLPGSQGSQVSYVMSFDLLCQPCESTPSRLESLMKDLGASPSIKHVLRSPQGIAFALLYESILKLTPEKALAFLRWAMSAPLAERQKAGFGKDWILANLSIHEQQQVITLISSEIIREELNRDVEWFKTAGIYDTPLLFVDGLPFMPDNSSEESYAEQVKRFTNATR